MSPLFICACNKFELSVAWRSPTGVKLWVATADFCLVCLLLLYFYFTLYIFILLHIICTAFLLPEEGVYSVDPARFSAPFTKTSLAVSYWTLRMEMYGWVSIQTSQPKQAILQTSFNFYVFFSAALQFQLVWSLKCCWA